MITYNEEKGSYSFYVYILTNKNKTTFYIGVTNNLAKRLQQHKESTANKASNFVGRYQLQHLIYYEKYTWIQNAIAREKELKGWRREKKLALIKRMNESMDFLENDFLNINP